MEGTNVDLGPEGLLNTTTELENLVRVLIIVRGNDDTPSAHLPIVIQKLGWIAKEVDETIRIVRGHELR